MKKILVTGGGGYVGSVLCEQLLEKGYHVICMDRFFFGLDSIKHLITNPNFSYVKDDVRWFDKNILKDVYCVLDLASLSNDPAGELDQSKTLEINHKGRVRVAKLCKDIGVKKYFLASTCSIYGFNENICDETSAINPLTTYAKASSMAEKEILGFADDKFCTTAFRFATIYGLSKRMRFDLVVNTMTLSLFQSQKIIVNGGGHQQRPLVDVRDACQAYLLGINTDDHLISGHIFNVGSNEQNYKIIDLANEIGKSLNLNYEIISKGDPDYRSYRIDFSKIKKNLSFKASYTPAKSAIEIFTKLKDGSLDYGMKTKTVDWYLHLLNNKDDSVAIDGKIL